ncbi:hypothetical protein JCM33374_g4004 [Metschnikowia sp. JCM 33374]|nr:hypothetical protein JCM33374_g4004 [Metschnikowia sp. JCM 33374]
MQAPRRVSSSNVRNRNESPFDDGVRDVPYESGSDAESDLDDKVPDKKEKSKRPPENNFSQQRLKAVNPVFTARSVIPILLLLGIFLVPLGAAMWLASYRIEDILIEYTHCEKQASRDHWSPIPAEYLKYHFKDNATIGNAQWKLDTDDTQAYDDEKNVCRVQFEIPHKIKGPLYFFYRLKNFHQNHRRYVKSFSEEQLNGQAASVSIIKNTVGLNCEPLSLDENGKRIYPCGLIANSLFNDTFSSTLAAVNGSTASYNMTNEGIAWSTNKNRFKKTQYNPEDIVPPPNWAKMFPNGYNSTNIPDISTWAEFQNWMFTSAFADFHKLALKNDQDAIEAGIYEVAIGLHFPVLPYDGKKYIFLSQRSVLGGKNYFLGSVWIASGAVCILLGIGLLVVNMLMPRRAGDVNLLSWNREAIARDEK